MLKRESRFPKVINQEGHRLTVAFFYYLNTVKVNTNIVAESAKLTKPALPETLAVPGFVVYSGATEK